MIDFLLGVPGKLKTISDYLTTYWTAARAAKLDFLTANVATATALSSVSTQITTVGKSQSVEFLSGSGNWTVPAGVSSVSVYMRGGGGGGGGGNNSWPGGGGGGGETVFYDSLPVTPGAALAYAVGTGGNAGALLASGTSGTATTFNGITADFGKLGNVGGSGWRGGLGGGAAWAINGTETVAAKITKYRVGGGSGGGGGGMSAIEGFTSAVQTGPIRCRGCGGGGGSAPGAAGAANSGYGGGGGYSNGPGSAGGSGYLLISWVA